MGNLNMISFQQSPCNVSSVLLFDCNAKAPFILSNGSRDNGGMDSFLSDKFICQPVLASLSAEPELRNVSVPLLSGELFDGVFVPVAKVTQCLHVWREKLRGDVNERYLLNGIANGFNIIDCPERPPSYDRRNYRSTAFENKAKVETRILEEVSKGNYIKTPIRPTYVSSLGAVPKDLDDVRLIHDLSRPNGGINILAHDTSVVYTTVDRITQLISKTSYLAKVDLKSAYRSIPICKECFGLTGIQWQFEGDREKTYLFDAKLPFGASMSCRIFQSISDSICRIMSRAGFTVEAYIDDFVCVGVDRLSCQACYDALISLIQSLGLEVNWHKAVGPDRCMTFLGVYINCVERTLSLPLNKLSELKQLLLSFAKRTKVTKVELQRILGKLNWASRVIQGGRAFVASSNRSQLQGS